MKKKLLIYYCFLLPIFIIPIKAHDNEDIHQRIVIEAYKLLKIQLSKEPNGIAGPYIMHPTDYYSAITVPQSSNSEFEDISKYPEFVKSAVYYDEIPDRMGYIWENMPPIDVVNKLAPKGNMQNLKGKRSVLAYRDNQDDPFHYVFFSYVARY